MNSREFNLVVEKAIQHIKDTLVVKNEEYADGGNVFRNFDTAAKMRGLTPEQALDGMLLKHLVSYGDMVDGKLKPTPELIKEKFGDILCYFLLQWGLMERSLGE